MAVSHVQPGLRGYDSLDITLLRIDDYAGKVDMVLKRRKGDPGAKGITVTSEGLQQLGGTLRLDTYRELRPERIEQALASAPRGIGRQAWVKRSGSADMLDPIREIGEHLFSELFRGERTRFLGRTLDESRASGSGLRLNLFIDDTRDAPWTLLPWEFLHDGREFICLSPWSPLVRTVKVMTTVDASPVTPPLRVLAITAGWVGQELDVLRAVAERSAALEVIADPSRDAFLEAVRTGKFNVLYLAGSAMAYSRGGSLTLEAQRPYLANADMLGEILEGKPALRLVHLSVNHTAQLASELAHFVPAVIGVQGKPGDAARYDFAGGMYPAILDGASLDAAVTAGRQMVDIRRPGSREWGLPVLYLQKPDQALLCQEREEPELGSVRSAVDAEGVGEPPADPRRRHEWEKARLMLEVYRRNLRELEGQSQSSIAPLPSVASQIKDVSEQIAKLEGRMQELESGEG